MTDKVTIHCLPTGIPGLDTILGGGLPEFSFNLIAGLPGCGKTTLAHQMMFAMATPERPALYLTVLGEPPLKMLRYQQQFAFFDFDRLERCVRYVNLGDDALAGDLGKVLERIVAEVQVHQPAFVFVDSFRSVVASRADTSDLQMFMQQLGSLMTSWQATTFLIGEYAADTEANPVFTVCDGIIRLDQSVERNTMVRKLEVTKMRGRASLAGRHTYRISPSGVTVFPPASAALPHRNGPALPPGRASVGNPALDAMLGGGLPRGYSLLVAGPSGSGKSVLAASFLAEGARQGEKGVIALFEQRANRSAQVVLSQLIASGDVALVDSRAVDLSIDEIVLLLLGEIRRLGATRVVIDSLSAFELSLTPTFRQDFRESMLRLVSALGHEGVSTLMTSELEDRYTDLRFSPYGTAFLTDAIIVQRYIEVDSRLQRVMAVVKVRDSAHSDALRLYTIDADGIQVGPTLQDREGLLGGRPTHRITGRDGP